MNTENKTIVCFQIGRGGRFHNGGHLTYCTYRTAKQHFNYADEKHPLFDNPENWFEIKRQIGDRPNLLEKWENNDIEFFKRKGFDVGDNWYFDSQGNPVVSVADVESGIFTLDFDGGCDTWHTQDLEECNEYELAAIINSDTDNVERAKELMVENGYVPAGWYDEEETEEEI